MLTKMVRVLSDLSLRRTQVNTAMGCLKQIAQRADLQEIAAYCLERFEVVIPRHVAIICRNVLAAGAKKGVDGNGYYTAMLMAVLCHYPELWQREVDFAGHSNLRLTCVLHWPWEAGLPIPWGDERDVAPSDGPKRSAVSRTEQKLRPIDKTAAIVTSKSVG